MKRALTHVGGEAAREGDPALAEALARALDVPPSAQGEDGEEGPERAHVHGFHAYPARLHPVTAARLLDVVAAPRVLDPFCGSGTVLVEAMLAGLHATGIDLNPIAARLSACKTRVREEEEIASIVRAAERARAHADERRTQRSGATRRYGEEDVRIFEPHVLLELDGLMAGIRKERDPKLRRDLEMIFSAIVVKVSRKVSDSSDKSAPRWLAAGYTAKLYLRKAEELARRLRAFMALLPERVGPARVIEGDALATDKIEPGSVGAIVTSPPYAATYDYLAHHALRMRWLGLASEQLARGEIGARRSYEGLEPRAARERFERELSRFFGFAARALEDGGKMTLVIADSGVRGGALRADLMVRAVAARHPLRVIASASQPRPHFHARGQMAFRKSPRREHAILLERARKID